MCGKSHLETKNGNRQIILEREYATVRKHVKLNKDELFTAFHTHTHMHTNKNISGIEVFLKNK